MESTASSRKIYLDVLRVLASFLVCYNHSFGYHLFLDQEADGSILSWFNVFLSAVTTMDIPLFFMISGALLLENRSPIKQSGKSAFSGRLC